MNQENLPQVPAEFARLERISSKDWQVKSISIWEELARPPASSYNLTSRAATGGVEFKAELLPITKRATDEILSLPGKCFFIGDNLFLIERCLENFTPYGSDTVEIWCRLIWAGSWAKQNNSFSSQALVSGDF